VPGRLMGTTPAQELRPLEPTPRSSDAKVAAVLDIAETEFRAGHFETCAAAIEIALRHAPHDPVPQRLLASINALLRERPPRRDERAHFHVACAKAHGLCGDLLAAAAEYRDALTFDCDLVEAHIGLSNLRMPGENYLGWLRRLHEVMKPESYLEIGVARGRSLAFAEASTIAIGVDPQPMLEIEPKTQIHIFCETSDDFFAQRRLPFLLNGRPLRLAFIDGLHVFQQSLKDFMSIEPFCDDRSVILIHDTVPLDERTQRPERQTKFYTGDVWKTVLCLKRIRPDLDIFTIATAWSGLTVILGLNPHSRVIYERYDETIAEFSNVPYSAIEGCINTSLNLVPNDWGIVAERLKRRRIL
jgi:hypothetical protein